MSDSYTLQQVIDDPEATLDRIAALERELADERTLSERYKQHRNKAEAQAAAMRKALEWYADEDNWKDRETSEADTTYDAGEKAREALKETNANMLTMSQRDSERIMAMASQAAAMREVLEEELISVDITDVKNPEWVCHECGVRSKAKRRPEIQHRPECIFHSNAGKRVLAVVEALRALLKDMEQRADMGMTGGRIDSEGMRVLAAGATVISNAYSSLAALDKENSNEN